MQGSKLLLRAVFAIAALSMAFGANAALFQTEFSGTVRNSTLTLNGVSAGDSAVIKVGLDNGGTDILNQVWTANDLQFITFDFNNGAILTTFLSPFGGGLFTDVGDFRTNASGSLISVMSSWSDFNVGNDWISNDPGVPFEWYLDGNNPVYRNVAGDLASIVLPSNDPNAPLLTDPANWSELSPVPVPAAVWLFGTALIGFLGFSKRRKAA